MNAENPCRYGALSEASPRMGMEPASSCAFNEGLLPITPADPVEVPQAARPRRLSIKPPPVENTD